MGNKMISKEKTKRVLQSEMREQQRQINQFRKAEKDWESRREELEKSVSKLQLLIKTTPARIINLDLDGNILFINHTTTKRTVNEVTGKSVFDFLSPAEQKKLKQILNKVIKTGRRYRYEPYITHPDGEKSWYENHVAPVKRNGKIVEFIITAKNITERKNAELELQKAHDKLKKSEEKRLLFLKSSPERMVNIDLKGKILYVNQAATRKLEDLIGTDTFQYITPEERIKLKRIIKEMVRTGKKKKYEAQYISPDGRNFHFDCTANPIKEDGKVVEILIIAADITEQRKAEAALKESEEKFRSLAEKSPNMIFINKGRRIIYVNKRCEEVMGYTRKEFFNAGFEFTALIAPESMAQTQKNYEKHFKGKDVHPYDNTLVTKDGKKLDVIITTKLIQYEGETATLGVVTDITERKKAEQNLIKAYDELERRVVERTAALTRANMQMKQEIEERKRAEKALQEREEMLRIILESSPDAIAVTDSKAILIECNQSNVDMLGYSSKGELIGKNAFTLIAQKDQKRARKNSEKTLKEGIIKNIDYTLVKKDGTGFPAEMSASVIHDASGKLAGFVAITKDITVRRKAEEALIRSEAELRKQKLALEEKNIALREIIAQIEIEKRKIEEDIDSNVELVLAPILEKLRSNEANHSYVNLLTHHLKGLTSSFGNKITDRDFNLTPREIEICNMIKGGMASKDISKLLNISSQTVERHRKNIRHKLGITNKRINLTSYLRKI